MHGRNTGRLRLASPKGCGKETKGWSSNEYRVPRGLHWPPSFLPCTSIYVPVLYFISVSHPPIHLLAKQRLLLCRLDKVSSRHDPQWTSRGVQRPQKISAGEHDQFHQEAMKWLVRVFMKPIYETTSLVFVSSEVAGPATAV